MSDRQARPDTGRAPDFLDLPADFWDSLLPPDVVPPLDPGSPVTFDGAPVVDPAPVPVVVPGPVTSARPGWGRRWAGAWSRSSPTLRTVVAALVVASALLAVFVAREGSSGAKGSQPATAQRPATDRPVAETPRTTAAPAVTAATAPPGVTVTTAAPAPAPASVTRPSTTQRPAPPGVTRQSPPTAGGRPTGPVCGFAAGATVDVSLNGQALGPYVADADGCVQVPVTR